MCDSLNEAMLERINSEEILLQAKDNVKSLNPQLKLQGLRLLKNIEDEVSRTAGLP